MTTLANYETPRRTSKAFDAITLGSPDGSTEAEFVPTANMLCGSLKHHGVEFLHRGAGVDAYADRGITMGIPLLHPWANRLAAFEYDAAGKHVRLQRGASPIATDAAGLPIQGHPGFPWVKVLAGYSWRPPQWKKMAVLKCSRLR